MRIREAGAGFVHGDVRAVEDLLALERVDAIVECSAEPSVMAGVDGAPGYLVETNLVGAYNCLELARRDGAQVVFLSTSRVYPYPALNQLRLREDATRLELEPEQEVGGASPAGISESSPLDGPRTLYGATKLAAELLVTEYAANFDLRTVVNRCGVIAGPWQMGRVDQGVFTFWLLHHHFGRPLTYIGYGGAGRQVRDLLHVDDLVDLVERQLTDPDHWHGRTFNAGGGRDVSLSLRETTDLCREITGNDVDVSPAGESRPGDVRIYLSDCRALFAHTDWRPQRGPRQVLQDIHDWVREHEQLVLAALG